MTARKRSTTSRKRKSDDTIADSTEAIAAYAKMQTAKNAGICDTLSVEIDATLPKATSKIWHAIPVWFVGENPVVGYKASAKYVNLLFWNRSEEHTSELQS